MMGKTKQSSTNAGMIEKMNQANNNASMMGALNQLNSNDAGATNETKQLNSNNASVVEEMKQLNSGYTETTRLVKSHDNYTGYDFPDDETFQKFYDDYMENQPSASDELRNSYQTIQQDFGNYIACIESETFRFAFLCGYAAAKKEAEDNE